jgi:hypothetical protein
MKSREPFNILVTPSLARYAMYLMESDLVGHEEISQSSAFRRFGRVTIEHWVKSGYIKKYLRGENRVSYKLRELLKVSAKEQDYS